MINRCKCVQFIRKVLGMEIRCLVFFFVCLSFQRSLLSNQSSLFQLPGTFITRTITQALLKKIGSFCLNYDGEMTSDSRTGLDLEVIVQMVPIRSVIRWVYMHESRTPVAGAETEPIFLNLCGQTSGNLHGIRLIVHGKKVYHEHPKAHVEWTWHFPLMERFKTSFWTVASTQRFSNSKETSYNLRLILIENNQTLLKETGISNVDKRTSQPLIRWRYLPTIGDPRSVHERRVK